MDDSGSPTATGTRQGLGPGTAPQMNGARSSQASSSKTKRPVSYQGLKSPIFDAPDTRRRSSTISLDSLNNARHSITSSTNDMWLPRPVTPSPSTDDGGLWQNAPLAFAILPALGGLIFTNGSAVVSDILLLVLAAIFLNWSIRLPWDWYRSAQELRVRGSDRGEYDGNSVLMDEDDLDYDSEAEAGPQTKDDADAGRPIRPPSARLRRQAELYDASKKELYRHELFALLACFAFPLLAAYLLHSLRENLSRPSEGLVSNFNLTIFLLAAELRPLSHLLKLVQARTLHLQRIVKDNPYTSVDEKQDLDISSIKARLAELEHHNSNPISTSSPDAVGKAASAELSARQVAVMTSGVRKTFQPDLDALNRAVRRYEKRATLQAMQTESRLLDIEARLGDAVALAAAAAKQRPGKSLIAVAVEYTGKAMVLPWQVGGWVMAMPWRLVRGVLEGLGFRKAVVERGVSMRTMPLPSGRRRVSRAGELGGDGTRLKGR